MPSRRRSTRLLFYRPAVQQEINDLIRGVSGGFLFGIPLLYTMEVWWIGSSVNPVIMLITIAVTFVVVFALNLTEGFRKSRGTTLHQVIDDTIDAIAIGMLSATLMLVLLREITLDTQLRETLGKIIFEGVPFALGVALSSQFLRPSDQRTDIDEHGIKTPPKALQRFFPENNLNETLADIGAALVGSLIVAFSIAPTDEVPKLVGAVQGPWLLSMVLISVAISYMIVFQANFAGQSERQMQSGPFQSPLSETIVAYLVSLGTAALMLVFFQAISWHTPWDVAFRHILILGLPSTIGGAAGRLAL